MARKIMSFIAAGMLLLLTICVTRTHAGSEEPVATGRVGATIYFQNIETTEKDTVPVVIEIRNDSDSPVKIARNLVLDLKAEVKTAAGSQIVPIKIAQVISEGDALNVVLRVTMPNVDGRDMPGFGAPLSLFDDEETTIKPGKSVLIRVDLPAKLLPQGVSIFQMALTKKGKDISVSASSKMTWPLVKVK